MNIILVSNKLAKAKSLTTGQTAALVVGLVFVPVLLTLLFITPKSNIKQHGVKAMLPPQLKHSIITSQVHLDAYAKELGELQARIMRLDAQNERLSRLTSEKDKSGNGEVRPKSENQSELPGRGGPLVYANPMNELDLQAAIDELAQAIDQRDEYLSALEAKVLQQSVLKDMLPNASPIRAAYNSSSYGWRIDPFNGSKAFHEGLDFTANTGVPILAAADGIVAAAEHTPDYGNLVKVDHGSGLETRYAHASRLLVKVGERVVKGQKIAEVGSTGRSTGPHLHYEIRLNGNSLDPRKYLQQKVS
jgi:murein DD-endopeptidase MepM/ murein hydrolase activator NlpD